MNNLNIELNKSSEVKKRQEIGRGLRLCVDQNGVRQHGFAINTLTVMANESYEDFANKLQKEYEDEEGIRFGIIEAHTFANIPVKTEAGMTEYLGTEKSEQIYNDFKENYVVYDSQVERGFAEGLDSNEKVRVFAKLPEWFRISTPLGAYNPGWAVLIEDDGQNKLYFVVETKGDIEIGALRGNELDKIRCGRKHFKALGEDITFEAADGYESFAESV